MSQQHDKLNDQLKKSDDKKQFDQKKPDNVKKKIENTGKKVNKARSKSDTDELVKNKITGADKEGPAY